MELSREEILGFLSIVAHELPGRSLAKPRCSSSAAPP